MFHPRFSYTPAITGMLNEIAGLRGRVDILAADEAVAATMRRRNAARRAAAACVLDGVWVSVEQAEQALAGETGELRPETVLALKNYGLALDSIAPESAAAEGEAAEKPFGVPALMAMHFHLLYDPATRKQVPGLRRERRGLVDVRDGMPLAFAPPPAELQATLRDLVGWLYSSRNAITPVLRAAIAHLRLIQLQPFASANGRAACVLTNMLLLSGEFSGDTLPALEEGFAYNLDHYYAQIVAAGDPEQWTGDVTNWLEYFCATLIDELRVVAASAPTESPAAEQEPLNSRQQRILEILTDSDAILTSQQCQELFDIGPVTATRDLRDLVERGIMVMQGQGEASYYVKRSE